MTTGFAGDVARPPLLARVRDILLRPKGEWARIANEEPASLLGGYVAPLAIAGALAGVAARLIYFGFALNAALAWALVSAVLYVVIAVVGVRAAAMLVNALAPRFGAEADAERATRLAAYSATAALVAGLGALIPMLAPVFYIAGAIYSILLLAMGVRPLLPMPEESVPRFTLTFTGLLLLLAALITAFTSPLLGTARTSLTGAVEAVTPAPPAPEITQRPPAELALARLAQASGAHILVDPARLEEQFPDTLPSGFARQSVSHGQAGGLSRADATYREGAATLTVTILQFGKATDPAATAALLAINEDARSEGGYARTQTIDGRLFAEEVSADNARYIVIGRGVVMIAAGGVTIDQARAAIETIDLQRLENAFGR